MNKSLSRCISSIYIILALIIIALLGYLIYDLNHQDLNCKSSQYNLTETEAILLLKNIYPEFENYPNQDNFPPKSISTEKDTNGWYISFIQEGSGRPVIGAKCFFVQNNRTIITIGEFKPRTQDINFSIRTCI